MEELQILYIEDNDDDVGLTRRALKNAGLAFSMQVVATEQEFLTALQAYKPQLILSDHSLPGFNSLEAFRLARQALTDVPFILLTGSVSEQFAVDCLLAGIDDYILKSNLIRLPSAIERALAKRRLSEEKDTVQKLHNELQQTYQQLEARTKEMTDSIYYARRIQEAILPLDSMFTQEFHDGFVIYQPRDIVSGDLYWLARTTTTDGKGLALKVLAAVDCTGHGVPGAFMSLLVSELLNQTLKNPDINSPAQVLTWLNFKLPLSLNKNNRGRINDGLDIALCALDLRARVAYFAGANRPLWLLRKSEILEFKGDRASIGGYTPMDYAFENQTIPLEPGDRLFLFTDGITDQFGGGNGKKMGRNILKTVLLESAQFTLQQQREVLASFISDWRKDLEQVDDMLLVGIEIS